MDDLRVCTPFLGRKPPIGTWQHEEVVIPPVSSGSLVPAQSRFRWSFEEYFGEYNKPSICG